MRFGQTAGRGLDEIGLLQPAKEFNASVRQTMRFSGTEKAGHLNRYDTMPGFYERSISCYFVSGVAGSGVSGVAGAGVSVWAGWVCSGAAGACSSCLAGSAFLGSSAFLQPIVAKDNVMKKVSERMSVSIFFIIYPPSLKCGFADCGLRIFFMLI
jgi:hypothetical protein